MSRSRRWVASSSRIAGLYLSDDEALYGFERGRIGDLKLDDSLPYSLKQFNLEVMEAFNHEAKSDIESGIELAPEYLEDASTISTGRFINDPQQKDFSNVPPNDS